MSEVFRIYADHGRYLYVQVRLFNTRKAMALDIRDYGLDSKVSNKVQGQVTGIAHYNCAGRLTGRFAVMWLNRADCRNNPAEIVSHEATHAAMRYANNKKADLSDMKGEEVLCHAQGHILRLLNDKLFKLGVYE